MTGHYECPISTCPETWNLPEIEMVPAAFADILGTTPLGMHEGWMHQAKVSLEHDMDRHLRTHPPADWAGEITRLKALIEGMTEAFASLQMIR